MTLNKKIQFIQDHLTHEDLLLQLAEECAELGHAALKVCRVLNPRNPTPQNMTGAIHNLHEEIADVALALKVLGFDLENDADRQDRMDKKLHRWVLRLKERFGE